MAKLNWHESDSNVTTNSVEAACHCRCFDSFCFSLLSFASESAYKACAVLCFVSTNGWLTDWLVGWILGRFVSSRGFIGVKHWKWFFGHKLCSQWISAWQLWFCGQHVVPFAHRNDTVWPLWYCCWLSERRPKCACANEKAFYFIRRMFSFPTMEHCRGLLLQVDSMWMNTTSPHRRCFSATIKAILLTTGIADVHVTPLLISFCIMFWIDSAVSLSVNGIIVEKRTMGFSSRFFVERRTFEFEKSLLGIATQWRTARITKKHRFLQIKIFILT